MKPLPRFAPMLLLVAFCSVPIASAGELLPVVNPTFSNVIVDCASRYVYQSSSGGTCAGPNVPQQDLNGTPRVGWTFSPAAAPDYHGTGLTGADTDFNPPPFTGLPFRQAAFLQDANSVVSQTISGFVAEQPYRMSFYLGSRYDGNTGGDQTVVALIDDHIIDAWTLVSFTPFTLRDVLFKVGSNGPHTLKFVGTASGDHTAFLSGVTIEAVDSADSLEW